MSKRLTELKMALALIETTVKTLPHIGEDNILNMLNGVRERFEIAVPVWIAKGEPVGSPEPAPAPKESPLAARPLADLLKAHGSPYSERTFIRKALKANILKQVPWPHATKPGKFRNKLQLTIYGETYGLPSVTSAQPLWYNSEFAQLLRILK